MPAIAGVHPFALDDGARSLPIAAQVAARLSQPTVLPDIPLSCCLDPTGRSRHGVSSA